MRVTFLSSNVAIMCAFPDYCGPARPGGKESICCHGSHNYQSPGYPPAAAPPPTAGGGSGLGHRRARHQQQK